MKSVMNLMDLGWDRFFDDRFASYRALGLSAMRITRAVREKYAVYGEQGEFLGILSGKFRFEADRKGKLPAVGDWVAASPRRQEGKAIIHAVLPRKSVFSRKVAGSVTEEQVLAANIDTSFIVCGLDFNFNLRRIERYLSLAWESGSQPVVLLNKADICPDVEARQKEVESIAPGVPVHIMSASRRVGLDALVEKIPRGNTAVFLGSSGVGKSTIINALLGIERLKVGEVRPFKSRGRHTTTFRELFVLPHGGMVIDSPGMRELQVWGDDEGLKRVFDDIEELAVDCRFKDCTHRTEPGCAVREAVDKGSLDPGRLKSHVKLKKEFAYLSDRQTMKPSAVEKARWKKISREARRLKKRNPLG